MKIGIITFHWASNYGAVLQCYALQQALKSLGHEVFIINYKSWIYENNLFTLFRYRRIFHLKQLFLSVEKEKLFQPFRDKLLNLSEPIKFQKKIGEFTEQLDCVISGSDQVLNPSYVKGGEIGGSTAYFLDFGRDNLKRIAYAVSFGTTDYPIDLLPRLKPLISKFNYISVREKTGLNIMEQMGRKDAIVVPDPTILLDKKEYLNIFQPKEADESICLYVLHDRNIIYEKVESYFKNELIVDNNGCSVEDWLCNIHKSKLMITNSFHGVVFSILFHIPFIVVLQFKENKGMNDRFYTLLSAIGLENRIVTEHEIDFNLSTNPIDWKLVDEMLIEYRAIGLDFLNKIN